MRNRDRREGILVLSDGSVFEGFVGGYIPDEGVSVGEIVFNTSLSGYQEIVSDPSYAGQVITFTYPHFGNYGTNDFDNESKMPRCSGVVVKDVTEIASNWRSQLNTEEWLINNKIPMITGIDTRKLTRHIRDLGAMGCAFGPLESADVKSLMELAKKDGPTDGKDLVSGVTCDTPYTVGNGPSNIVAIDYGIKTTILRNLAQFATVTVVPATTKADEILSGDVFKREVNGVFLSNGPGDPGVVDYAVDTISQLLGNVPIFGICLGHQLLSRSIGARTIKLPFGHHGGNHPVKNLSKQSIEVTSQNHSYAVDPGSLTNAIVTHLNLNDGVVEGIELNDVPAFSVQYHPEAGPGPHDAHYLFDQFKDLIDKCSSKGKVK
ncbi:MAG: glutamine-hydrolyzing carbamoyl-phosphate synthase small subunit [Acidimicrobiales bacterium]|nr:glutamine-hydrolyzing carbamoyl-phosphate synthase small subunit [Acidimicrobiales bacterium]